MDEAACIDRARRGDQDAWELIIRQHQEAVFRLVYLLLGDASQAEDVAQEAFIRAYRSFRRFDASKPLRPWLLTIASNLARNHQRSAARYLAAIHRLVNDIGPPESTERLTMRNLDAESLWRAVRDLSIEDQKLIYLRFFLDLPVLETAQVFSIPEGTVKSRLHRALERLRRVIEQKYPALHAGQFR